MLDNQQVTKLNKLSSQALNEEIDQLDDLTLAKLQAARLKALEPKATLFDWRNVLLGKTGAFASVALACVLLLYMQQEQSNIVEFDMAAVLNPVLAEDPEMLAELEFIAWLEQEQVLENIENT